MTSSRKWKEEEIFEAYNAKTRIHVERRGRSVDEEITFIILDYTFRTCFRHCIISFSRSLAFPRLFSTCVRSLGVRSSRPCSLMRPLSFGYGRWRCEHNAFLVGIDSPACARSRIVIVRTYLEEDQKPEDHKEVQRVLRSKLGKTMNRVKEKKVKGFSSFPWTIRNALKDLEPKKKQVA